jgi:phosphatidylinositol alpha-mannosyltransferase
MRIGMVCPYSFDVPGGVQNHISDLTETLIGLGHQVSVLAPAEDGANLPPEVVSAGRSLSFPSNGSVARIAFGPIAAARVRRWLTAGRFDVLHVHEPMAPSLSMLACLAARGPVVATFHFAGQRDRKMVAARGALQLVLEKITARIAVSALARKAQVEHLGGGAVEIPNGVVVSRFAGAEPLEGWPGAELSAPGSTVGFLGRFTEPRKGFDILADALARLVPDRPELRLLVAGPGDADELAERVPAALRGHVTFIGRISEAAKPRMLSSTHVYAAPNTGGESFGMILTEALAAGTPVLASDLDAFRRVLDGGRAGALFTTGDAGSLATELAALLDAPHRRAALAARGREVVAAYDWPVVAERVLEVYASAMAAAGTEPALDRGSQR